MQNTVVFQYFRIVALSCAMVCGLSLSALTSDFVYAQTPKASAPEPDGTPRSLKPADLKTLRSVIVKYQTSTSAVMDVDKTLRLGLLGQEKQSKGKLEMASGKMRMELEGASEKTLLVVNLKNLWAVTFPPAEFKDAAVQVITGEVNSKKGRSQAIVGLLSQGGLLKFFKPTAVQTRSSGETVYFLEPFKQQVDFKRAQIVVSKDKKEMSELRYWDERDNETHFKFSNVEFGKKLDNKIFTYTPPANADVMKL